LIEKILAVQASIDAKAGGEAGCNQQVAGRLLPVTRIIQATS
jgi:hypothetical protein